MRISKLNIDGFRNIKRADLETDSPFVVITGDNAAGKTSVLEAIYLNLAGRSFRTREWTKLIGYEGTESVVTASIGNHFVGASRARGRKPQHKLDGDDVSLSEIAKKFPVQLFDTNLFEIFEGSPRYRRELIDWSLFHVKQDFYIVWRSYHHALKQRNRLLKGGCLNTSLLNSQLDSWDRELVKFGDNLSNSREHYAQMLLDRCSCNTLLSDISINTEYYSGWSSSLDSFADALRSSRERDVKYKRTTIGPHHADLLFTANTKKAGDTLSRGQKKLAGFAIKLEQVRMYNEQSDLNCMILCDDFSAEIDVINQRKILECIANLGSQVFLTVIDFDSFRTVMPDLEKIKVFHVKQGVFQERAER